VEDEDLESGIRKFSDARVAEIASEFSHQYGGLDPLIRKFSRWPKEFLVEKLKETTEDIWLEIECGQDLAREYAWAGGYAHDVEGFARSLLACGILLYKSDRTAEPVIYDLDQRPEVSANSWVALHPAFWPALGIS
jgi:hypothetical protein